MSKKQTKKASYRPSETSGVYLKKGKETVLMYMHLTTFKYVLYARYYKKINIVSN